MYFRGGSRTQEFEHPGYSGVVSVYLVLGKVGKQLEWGVNLTTPRRREFSERSNSLAISSSPRHLMDGWDHQTQVSRIQTTVHSQVCSICLRMQPTEHY